MKRTTQHALSVLALVLSANTVAEEVPVIELGEARTVTPQPGYSSTSPNTELMMIVQQLQDEVRNLRGQLEQQSYRLKQMERQQLDRYRDLDRRIGAIGTSPTATSVSTAPATSATVAAEAPQSAATAASATAAQSTVAQTDAAPSDAQAYREAFGLVRERNFSKAVEAFNGFIKNYPNSPRLANAHYWLGEVHLAEQKPELARESFVQVITNFSKHNKAPDAAYKLGIVYDQLGDTEKSNQYLDMVITKYPNSPAVRLAQEFKRQN